MNFYLLDWYVDIDGNQISAGEQRVKLENKVMTLLVYLAKHQGDVISREKLEASVWPEQVTGYDALTTCLTRLRKALGDTPRHPLYIQTVTKKGYRLIAPVRWEQQPEKPAITKTTKPYPINKILGFAALLIVLFVGFFMYPTDKASNQTPASQTSSPSIIVMPFDNLSHEPTQAYFSDGITADLRIALSRISGLQLVNAPKGRLNYKPDSTYLQEIDYRLQGSVQRADNMLRVNVGLIDNKSNHQLWAESYDQEITEIFKVQDEIKSLIVSKLSIKLTKQEKTRAARRYTRSIEAYDLFLKAQSLYVQHTKISNFAARQVFQQAIDLDPAFARAYSAQSLTYTDEYRFHWNLEGINPIQTAISKAQKAITIDNELPQAHWALAHAHLHNHNYRQAILSAEKSLALSPHYVDALATLAVSHIYSGNEQKGVDMLLKIITDASYYPAPYASALGQAYYLLGANEKALSLFQDALEKNHGLLTAHVMLVATLTQLKMTEDAEWAAEQLDTIAPDFKLKNVARVFPITDRNKLQRITNNLRRAGIQ